MTRILVAGELNADLVMSGLETLPILGRELIAGGFKQVMGSSSAITAARLARLGASVDFAGIVGEDDLGDFVLRELGAFGVNTGDVRRVQTATGVTIALTYSQDRALLTFPGTIETYAGDDLTAECLHGYDHIHVGSFFLQTALQPHLARIFSEAHTQGLTTSLDVGWDPSEKWSGNPHLVPTLAHVDYFLPNEDEVTALAGGTDSPGIVANWVGGTLIVKQGSKGARAYDKSGDVASAASFAVDVVDTTGAGDAFNAGFIYARCVEGQPIAEAMRFAAACGAQAVTQIGGATNAPNADDIHAFMR
jgi:sugar/nucleoside kinase (ribokinase family)